MGKSTRVFYHYVLPGLCGLYNKDSGDDLTLRNGTPVAKVDKDVFGNNWAVMSGKKYINTFFFICETKKQISCAITVRLISAFVFAT